MRIKCIVTYDGTHFYGWQIQPDKRTVQEEIQKAIYKITREEVTIHSSGRTDAGVHAVGQVFHFDILRILVLYVPIQPTANKFAVICLCTLLLY